MSSKNVKKVFTPEEVLNELRKCYRYMVDGNDFQFSLRHYFDDVCEVPYPSVLAFARKYSKIREALEKLYQVNKLKEVEFMYGYLKAMKKWYQGDEKAIFLLEFFEKYPYFTKSRIEKLVEENELIREQWEELLALQEVRVVKAMLNGRSEKKYIFILKNMHGWKDKTDIDISDSSYNIKLERETVKPESSARDSIDVKGDVVDDKVIKLGENA